MDMMLPPDEGDDQRRAVRPPAAPSLLLPPEPDPVASANIREALPTSPDKAAQAKALSDATGYPMPTVQRNLEDVAHAEKLRNIQIQMASNPILARQMRDPVFAALSHDDTDNLTLLERTFKTYLGASVKSGVESLVGVGAKLVDTLNPFTLSEQDAAVLYKDDPAKLAELQNTSPAMALSRFTRAMQQASEATMANVNASAQIDYGRLKYATLNPREAAYLSPVKVLGDTMQSLPTSLALAVSAYLTKGVATRVEAKALAEGVTPELARSAAIHAAIETMAKLSASTEGAAGYAQQAMQTREQAGRVSDSTLQSSPEYQKLISRGYSPEAARLRVSALASEVAGATGGAVDAITNFYGGSILGRVLGEGGKLLPRTAKGFATEAATEAVQSGVEQLGQNAAVQQFLDPHQALLDGVAENIAQGFVVGGVTGGAFSAVLGRNRQAQNAARDSEALKQLLQAAAASKLRERSPATFTQFVNNAASEGPVDAVYVNAAQFAQGAAEAGIDLAKQMPETASNIESAVAAGSDVRIPLGEFASAIPGTTLEQSIIPHLRTSPDGPTQAEASDKAWVAETQAQTEKILAEHEFNDAWKQSTATVERELLTQLANANRFTPDVNKAYAGFMSAFYATQAHRLGITPEEMYVKYPLQVRAAGTGTFDQGVESVTKPISVKDAIKLVTGKTEKPGGTDPTKHLEVGSKNGREYRVGEIPLSMFKDNEEADRYDGTVDAARAADYVARGAGAPPIIAVVSPKTGKLNVIDGGHRITAARARGDKTIHAIVGTRQKLDQPAYHGSPHNVDKFSTDHIGTGEGAQAYGWGLYFAENPAVAAGYFRQLANSPGPRRIKLGGLTMSQATHWDYNPKGNSTYENIRSSLAESLLIDENALYAVGVDGFQKHVLAVLDDKIEQYKTEWPEAVADAEKLRADLAKKGAVSIAFHKETGGVYQVDIPDEQVAKMLDWDKTIAEQTDAVRRAIVSIPGVSEHFDKLNAEDDALLVELGHADATGGVWPVMSGEGFYQHLSRQLGGDEHASKALAAAGIPGLFYNDAFSRDSEKEEKTRNIVVFDDSIIKLTHKDGTPVTQQERNEYLQQTSAGTRGNITFGENIQQQPSIITLLANADLSTFLHESGHFYLEVLTDMANQPDAPQAIKDDLDKVLAWFGVTPGEWANMHIEQKRPYHEQWARGFEAYLFEGKAPSTELQGPFARFRAWMLNVYRQLKTLNVSLTDEVRGVMDRLMATNDEIVAAENARNMMPLYETKPDGMSEAEWQDYQALGMDATQAAVDQLQSRSLRDMQWATNARGRALAALQKDAATKRKGVRAEVTAEVNAQPIYAAERWLKYGEMVDADGNEVKAEQGFKLDTEALAAMYPDSMLARPDLTKLGKGKYGMTATNGLAPDMVAEMFGFSSGDELVRKLIEAEPRNQVIEGITDQRMLERFGDLADPASIAKAADEAVHNEARAKFVATELRTLAKATGQRKTLTSAARDFAQTLIARKKIKDIKPAQYTAAETRAAKAAERAIAQDDLVSAAAQKRNQLVNLYAAKAAYDASAEVEKAVTYLKRVGESKTIDFEYRDQINALLERFDLRAVSNKDAARRSSLAQWIETQKDKGLEPVIDEALTNEANRKPYREMSLEDFRGLVDAVRNIEHLGRLKHKLLTLKDQREFAAVVDSLVTSIEEHAKRTLPVKLEHNTWLDKMKGGFAEFFAMHRKFALMAREIDGHQDNGTFWNILVKPMNEAGDNESVLREQATIKLQELFEPILKAGKLREKMFIPQINGSLSREGRIMVALNTGNDGNLQRLMDGDHWTINQVQAVVDTLTKQEMDFVQAVWDFIGAYRSQIGEQQKRLTGITPEWVEPRKVLTPHGEYAGGYLPAKYDTTRSTRSLSDEAAAGIMDQWRAKRGAAKARDSFTKGRADKVVNRPLRKDFGVITQHITEVTHRLAWQDYLTDATRLLRASGIDNAIRDHYGPEVLKALRDNIEDIAAGEVGAQNAFERGVNYLRTGATIAGLGWRITTSLLQPIGLTQSMVRIGPKWVGKGLAEWLGDAAKMENTAKRIFEKSDMMRLRAKTMQREISEIRNQVSGKSSAIEASYFYLIQKMQLVADIPTWLGQYHKAVEGGADESNAVAQADQAVLDAQGGGQIKDLAAIQRGGPMLKLFTNFYSFFNTTYNLTGEAVGRTNFKDPIAVGRLAVDMMLLYSVPAVLGTLMKAALHSGDDDAQKNLIRQLIADQLTYLFGTVVGLRELAGGLQTTLGLPGDYQGPASVRLFAEVAKLGKQAGQGEVDEALLKAADNVGGILFHYPAGQINATVDGIVTMAQGKTDNPGALIVGSNKR